MTKEEQEALTPWWVAQVPRMIGMVPHDAITQFDPDSGYDFWCESGHTWGYYQETRYTIDRDKLYVCPHCGKNAATITTFGQQYYYQMDHGKLCLTRFNNGPYEKTPARIEAQEKFKQAVENWSNMTSSEKKEWSEHPEAAWRELPGRNIYISYFMTGEI